MKHMMKSVVTMLVIGALALPALAQDGPAPGPRDRGGDFPPDGRGRGPGPGGRGPGGMRPAPDMQKFEMLRAYIDVVDRLTKLASDPSTSGVAAVVSAADILRQRGPESAIEYFNKILPEVKDEAVRRAIRIQLSDLYRAAGQSEQALEHLDVLIKGAGAGSVPASPTTAQ